MRSPCQTIPVWPPSSDRKSTRLNSSHVKNLVCRLLLEKKKKKASQKLVSKKKNNISIRQLTLTKNNLIKCSCNKVVIIIDLHFFFFLFFFFFNDTATTEIYTLSLHDALPISWPTRRRSARPSPTGSTSM